IGLRGYGQKDPLVEYKAEGFRMFQDLMNNIQNNVVKTIYRIGVKAPEKAAQRSTGYKNMREQGAQLASSFSQARAAKSGKEGAAQPVRKAPAETVGRNDLCPCGSGKKYKKCHGK
ncbi:MAG TPA: SEC-C metal-binding domain-containing protein, partial [bacterium]|nr:SEC-C metal-binding domain-containing protein [bacterium]